jgi:predicted DNA-binding transcriptional regulator AlpA
VSLRATPSFEDLLANPSRAAELPAAAARELFVRLAAVQAALTTALLPAQSPEQSSSWNGDRFLDATEVGAIIGKSKSWVEKNTGSLPARRKVGGEGKWSEREIQTWMKHREPWD